ncbi:MAG: deoxyribodipyrimidine photo-lyase, partial [Wolinella sp.]
MRSLIWFRRDLRLEDNRTFEQASGEVLPLFIFDSHLLSPLPKEDRRVGYIYGEVMRLKSELRARGLDLAIFYGEPLKILSRLKEQGFSRLFASQDYDSYALSRDKTARELLDCRFVLDNYLFDPNEVLKKEGSPYTIFSAYYNQSLKILSEGHYAKGLDLPKKLAPYPIPAPPSLESMGFSPLPLLESLKTPPQKRLEEFSSKITRYALDRDSLEAEA